MGNPGTDNTYTVIVIVIIIVTDISDEWNFYKPDKQMLHSQPHLFAVEYPVDRWDCNVQ